MLAKATIATAQRQLQPLPISRVVMPEAGS
jgi:hypothetical protein